MLYQYRDDYIDNPRDTESSNKVVRLWYDERVRYAEEEILDDRCMGLVAERLIVRRLLGIEALDMAYMPKATRAKPFGPDTPMLAELLMPGTFITMALVPLSPQGIQGRPIVARLYCVTGLSNRYALPLDGFDEKVLQGFSWFLTGVPQEKLIHGVVGRSWLLAANLLARIVERRDVKTARNLAKHYIVTGDVLDGVIHRVEMLRKPELAKQFDNFKWIIPKENDMDIPKRKIEKPETLEEAYLLIESMRSTATKSFFRFLRKGDLTGVQEQCRIGADLFAREEGTDLTCLEVVANEKAKLYAANEESTKAKDEVVKVDIETYKKEVRSQIAKFDAVSRWLRLQGTDSAMMFYFMAVNGDEAGIAKMREYCPIDACDEHGLTAVDMALVESEFEVAKLLHRHGGVPNTRWEANPKLASAIHSFCDMSKPAQPQQIKLIVAAIEAGLSPETRVECRYRLGDPFADPDARDYFDFASFYADADSHKVPPSLKFDGEIVAYWDRCRCGSLYAFAVQFAQYDVLEACLKNGSDANQVLSYKDKDYGYSKEGRLLVTQSPALPLDRGMPWTILSEHNDMNGETRQSFRELLCRYGADIVEE